MEQVTTLQSPKKKLELQFVIMTMGYLTGSIEEKYFPQVFLGLGSFKTFPVTENLMPEGSVTIQKWKDHG